MMRAPNMDPAGLKEQFRELLRASGWSQAEAARQLAMTPSALSQIVRRNSPVRPSPVTLRLFRLLLLREKPEGLRVLARPAPPPAEEPWAGDLLQALRKIPPKTRQSILGTLRALLAAAQKTARERRPSKRSGGRPPEHG
ncbi:MAG: helix-turn-helix transcriptional regulator [Verrucomicrobiota bacterium]|jgi:transcriptional regulator with XRE-family HTH domain